MKFCVVGGGGYVGYHISKQLVSDGHTVVTLDIREPSSCWKEPGINVPYINGSLLNVEQLEKAFHNVDCVIHTAGFGMSGREQLPVHRNKTEDVNVNGTKNVIKACCTQDVKALVYTSTYNVVYGGTEIHNGDETLPYYPLNMQVDYYSLTKSIAEQMVILSNDKVTKSCAQLKTCVLRMAGIFGPGEERHLPRIMNLARYGGTCIKYGSADNKVDFVSIQNATQAHVKAAYCLLKTEKQTNAGQAYFISDGQPISNFEYFGNIFGQLGYPLPRLIIPLTIMWWLACIMESVPSLFWQTTKLTPIITKTEVLKTGVTHYFSIQKARNDFGYNPTKPNDVSEIVSWLKESGYSAPGMCTKMGFLIPVVILIIAIIITIKF